MTEPINLTQLREAINISADPQTVHVNGDIVLALIDIAEASHALDLEECRHGIGWAYSEGALDSPGPVNDQLDRLRDALARVTFTDPAPR